MKKDVDQVERPRRKAADLERRDIAERLNRPVKIRVSSSLGIRKSPERGSECRWNVAQSADLPVFDDLEFVIPDEACAQSVGIGEKCDNGNQQEVRWFRTKFSFGRHEAASLAELG